MTMYPDYSNKHLIEVNCGFQFPMETASWDSTYFGQFYEKVKNKGFNDRQERKGVHITFKTNASNHEGLPDSTSQQEHQVVFNNFSQGYAILLRKGGISFHCTSNYRGWDAFKNELIVPFFQIYHELGLGNGKRECSVVYLNQFQKSFDDSLSDLFNIVGVVEYSSGKEILTSVQRMFWSPDNTLIAKLIAQKSGEFQIINLECGAVCTNDDLMQNADWETHADRTRLPIRDFFEAIVKDNLKAEL